MRNIDFGVLLEGMKEQNNWGSKMKHGASHDRSHSVDQGADSHLVRLKKKNIYCHDHANALIATFGNGAQDHNGRDLDRPKRHTSSRAHSGRHYDDIHLSRRDSACSRDSVCPGTEAAEEGDPRRDVVADHRDQSGVLGAQNRILCRRRMGGERGQRAGVRNRGRCVGARGQRGESGPGDRGQEERGCLAAVVAEAHIDLRRASRGTRTLLAIGWTCRGVLFGAMS